mmetsp:Transcript_90550/g.242495  ORF Transcript_90550/g.242495 Transcript_90550/m.242495 type:complete len:517 (-) Transcript_90550:1157-2707(-)
MLPVDSSMTSQPHLVILLLRQLELVGLLQLLDLAIRIRLQLPQRLIVQLRFQLLLGLDALPFLEVLALLLLELGFHARDHLLVVFDSLLVLLVPFLPLTGKVLRQLPVPLHLNEHLVLERLLELRCLLRVVFFQRLDVLLVLHLHVVLLLTEQLVLGPLLLDFLAVLVLQLCHLLLVKTVTVTELEVNLAGQFVHLPLEIKDLSLLIIKERSCNENLIREHKHRVFVPLAPRAFLLSDVEDVQAPVLPGGEQELVIESEPQPGDLGGVSLVFYVFALVQRKPDTSDRARSALLRDPREQHLRGRAAAELAHGGSHLLGPHHGAALDFPQHLVGAGHENGVGAGALGAAAGRARVAKHNDRGQGGGLIRPVRLPLPLLDDVVLHHRPVLHAGGQAGIIACPGQRAYLPVVSPQVAHHLTRVRLVDLDGVGVHSRKILPPVAEPALSAGLDWHLLVALDLFHEQIHQTQLVGEPDDEMKPAGVKRHREGLLSEGLRELRGLVDVIPHPYCLVLAASYS